MFQVQWVEVVSSFKVELDAWSNGSQQSLDEYMSTSWLSVSGKIVVLMALLFIGVKLSDEMLMSEECTDLSRHVSIIIRLINDVCSFEVSFLFSPLKYLINKNKNKKFSKYVETYCCN